MIISIVKTVKLFGTVFLQIALQKLISGRRKRQIVGGGGGNRFKPPPSADFNTAAIFLKKYMELDETDRQAIGHRSGPSYIKFYSLSTGGPRYMR
jgi:hypothetical protein